MLDPSERAFGAQVLDGSELPGAMQRSNSEPRAHSLHGVELLVEVVQELSLVRDLAGVVEIVRRAARALTGADGATFVLRDGDHCHYVDEDAIEPLWKGQRFPVEACISGWSMLQRQPAMIEDIYQDVRVPADAYRPTFVKSLLMVPIRTAAPVGAIGNYWARPHTPTREEVKLLAALADSTSIAIENIQLYGTLEQRVAERTAQLAESQAHLREEHQALLLAQRQKEELAALLVHDLKSPAVGIMLSCRSRMRRSDLPEQERQLCKRMFANAEVITRTASNLLDIAHSEDGGLRVHLEPFDLPSLLDEVVFATTPLAEGRDQRIELVTRIAAPELLADRELVRRVLQNLIDNAVRHGPRGSTVGLQALEDEQAIELRVSDQGSGISEAERELIFERYTRLDTNLGASVGAGHGLGLSLCRLAVEGHGGTIWVEPNRPQGCVFVVRLPRTQAEPSTRGRQH